MISKVSSVIRSLIVIALTLILAFVCIVRLARMQLVDGSYYAAQLQQSYSDTKRTGSKRTLRTQTVSFCPGTRSSIK